MSESERYFTIDLKEVVEQAFTAEELAGLAALEKPEKFLDVVDEWTNPLMDGLTEVHNFEGVVMDYIRNNYRSAK